jgi:hypothetical protein
MGSDPVNASPKVFRLYEETRKAMLMKIKIILLSFIVLTIFEKSVRALYIQYYDIINREFGSIGGYLYIISYHLPVTLFVVIIFIIFLKKYSQKNIVLWSLFALINYPVAIPVFLLLFFNEDQEDTIKKNQTTV